MTYQITFTDDFDTTRKSEEITARTYTEAYLLFALKRDKKDLILEITEDLKA